MPRWIDACKDVSVDDHDADGDDKDEEPR